jgi:hypothetical protein
MYSTKVSFCVVEDPLEATNATYFDAPIRYPEEKLTYDMLLHMLESNWSLYSVRIPTDETDIIDICYKRTGKDVSQNWTGFCSQICSVYSCGKLLVFEYLLN